MSDTLGIGAGLAEMATELGTSFTWLEDDEDYACVPGPLSVGAQVEVGGVMAEITLSLGVQASLFTSARPASGQKITYRSTDYRILSVGADETNSALALYCGPLTG